MEGKKPQSLSALRYCVFVMYYVYVMSGSSLLIESTDSMMMSPRDVTQSITVYNDMYSTDKLQPQLWHQVWKEVFLLLLQWNFQQ